MVNFVKALVHKVRRPLSFRVKISKESKYLSKKPVLAKFLRLVLVCTLFFFAGLVIFSHKFEKLVCKAQNGDCYDSIIRDLELEKDLTFITARNKIKEVLIRNVYVEKYNFQFLLPNTIIIQIVQKEPFFSLVSDSESRQTLIARDGTILEMAEVSSFPLLRIYDREYSNGSKVKDNVQFALEITTSLDKVYKIKESNLRRSYLEVVFLNGKTVLFPDHGNLEILTGSVVLIFNQLNKDDNDPRIDSNKAAILDLRFKYPVLKREI